MVGKGSVNHNSRKFHAKNTDPERSYLNVEYCNENLQLVYHQLFDEAKQRYNAKQKRADRMIPDYYEKIRSGKQEKLFHEVIVQIGNREDMNAQSENGALAAQVLDEYMREFQKRNPNLRVFSAHLHMDEATPHLHIDFVPFTTGSKRGMDTRVSLKKALAAQGYTGGSRGDTEWNQWVAAEKNALAVVMERHGIQWEKKGTHEKHLSVLEFEKRERAKEVAALALAVGTIPIIARQLRSSTMLINSQEYIEAARSFGESNFKIIMTHVIPNCMAPIIVQASLYIGGAIMGIAGLSFLGLGVQPPTPEWGNILNNGLDFIYDFSTRWHVIVFPALFIVVAELCFNLLGDGLRDAMDPRMRK